MPPLQVRDLPQEIYAPLKHITELEHRSLAQQTIVALEYYLENHEIRGGKVVEKRNVASSFVPFDREGVAYMVDPNETSQAREERLGALFDRIRHRKLPDAPEGFGDVAEMLRQERESRAERVLEASREGLWQS